jgi:hypothetical protein
MKILGYVADRLLGVVVPEIKASACCGGAGMTFKQNCGCLGNGVGLQKKCTVTCTCTISCGACNITIANSSCR